MYSIQQRMMSSQCCLKGIKTSFSPMTGTFQESLRVRRGHIVKAMAKLVSLVSNFCLCHITLVLALIALFLYWFFAAFSSVQISQKGFLQPGKAAMTR
jgi:hypothetical protein